MNCPDNIVLVMASMFFIGLGIGALIIIMINWLTSLAKERESIADDLRYVESMRKEPYQCNGDNLPPGFGPKSSKDPNDCN